MSASRCLTSLLCLILAGGCARPLDVPHSSLALQAGSCLATTQGVHECSGAAALPALRPTSKPSFDVVVTNEEEDLRHVLFVRPKKDKDGRLPEDVVAAFLKDVAVADVTAARQWWVDTPDDFHSNDSTFEDYFVQLRKRLGPADRAAIIETMRGKGNFQVIWRASRGDERVMQESYFVKQVEGKWRISRWAHW